MNEKVNKCSLRSFCLLPDGRKLHLLPVPMSLLLNHLPYYYLLKSIYLLAYRANLQSMPRFKRIFLVFKINHMNDFRKSLQLTASITKVVVSYHLFCSFGDWRTAKFEFSVVVNLKHVSQFLGIYN